MQVRLELTQAKEQETLAKFQESLAIVEQNHLDRAEVAYWLIKQSIFFDWSRQSSNVIKQKLNLLKRKSDWKPSSMKWTKKSAMKSRISNSFRNNVPRRISLKYFQLIDVETLPSFLLDQTIGRSMCTIWINHRSISSGEDFPGSWLRCLERTYSTARIGFKSS